MKITEYSAIKSFTEDQVLLVDGNGGTKNIRIGDAIQAMLDFMSPQNHKTIFRGKNLGSVLTSEQKAAIQAGTFEDLWLGDYWEINGIKWRIADFDYWMNTGHPTKLTSHHLVIIPDTCLYMAKMNNSDTTSGGYVGSVMYTTNLANAKTLVANTFGDSVLSHREHLSNAVTNGYPSGGALYDSEVDIPSEVMMYGHAQLMPMSTGSVIVTNHAISKTQLSLMRVCPEFIVDINNAAWLRDVVSGSTFAIVDGAGTASFSYAGVERGVRPVFAIG